jgi:ribosome-associated translation inhibitor RaiA
MRRKAVLVKDIAVTRSEIWRLEKYLRGLFRLDTITIVERPKQQDSVEVHINGDFIGVLFKDEEDGEISYAFNMAILEMDLPEAPAGRS